MEESARRDIDPEVFCALPWFHASVSVDGVWGRCCFDNTNDYDNYYRQPTRPAMTLKPDAIGCIPGSEFAADNPDRVFNASAVLDTPAMRTTRTEMLNGQRPAACAYCYHAEAHGLTSHRQRVNVGFADRADIRALVDQTGPAGELNHEPVSLELRLGNTCGLTCIMCSFPTSSGFGRELSATWTQSQIDPFHRNDEFWTDLHAITGIKYLYFAGGEPFLQRSHLPFLDQLINSGRASDIALQYNSNLMQLPTAYFERFPRFRHVAIDASCDGVGDTFEHIRRGASWPKFIENVRLASKHVEVRFDVAVQRDNVMELESVIDVAAEENITPRFHNVVFYPDELSILAMPRSQQAAARDYLTRLIARCAAIGYDSCVEELTNIRAVMQPGP